VRQSCAFQVSSLEGPKTRPLIVQTGQCKNFACDDIAPSPGLGKRIVLQKHLTERVCPAGFEPCPISSKGYEVRMISSDIKGRALMELSTVYRLYERH
jgi:hypothetical protein